MTEVEARILVRVQTNTRRSEIVSFEEGVLRIKLSAPPVKGKANKALIEFLRKTLKVSRNNIEIEKGATSRQKIVSIKNMDQAQFKERLGNWGHDNV
ncbi:MAG: DUF167 domain-containing protein [Chloroflexota bacterium]|nr:DUF167 domain-containing protein [Chloroflexota bacterium]